MPRMQKMIDKRCSKFLDPGETLESTILTSAPGMYMAFFAGGFGGVLINRIAQSKKSSRANGESARPYGTALLFPGGEMFLSVISSGDLVIWKRGFTGRFTGIAARIPASSISSLENAGGKLRAKVTFHFSDGSVLRANVNAVRDYEAFSASLQRRGVGSVSV